MKSRCRRLVSLVAALALIGAVTTNCAGTRNGYREHWWEVWKTGKPPFVIPPTGWDEPRLPEPIPDLLDREDERGKVEIVLDEWPDGGLGIEEARRTRLGEDLRIDPLEVKLLTVNFAFDRYDLTPEARWVLDENAQYVLAHPQVRVLIEGHCDERGTIEYNLNLGQRRASSVREYLISKGVPADRLETISHGEYRPVDPTHNRTAWAKNRRAQFSAF